ncbi:MAG: phosphodiester glycosidase family protein [Oscillospiraceae bacterium]|nr:phosphodiester glycosidase family protein [Oscillospiraceae bacterium]
MNDQELSIDELLADASKFLNDSVTPEKEQTIPEVRKPEKKKPVKKADKKDEKTKKFIKQEKSPKEKSPETDSKPGSGRKIFGILGKIMLVILETVLLLVIALYGVMFVLAKGPSPTARDLFVMSVRETSAMGWVANIFFMEDEIAKIENPKQIDEYIEIDTSLIQIPQETDPVDGEEDSEDQGPKADAWGLIDEDGDGIIVEEVKGEGYSGYMMVVLDPSRVIVGSVPGSYGARGYTVEEMVEKFDAVAGTNAGGFHDPNGTGNGSIPDTLVVFEGKVHYAGFGTRKGFVGIDDNYILHVANKITEAEIKERNIQYGVCFGPVLVANGEPCEINISGVNPRTAIGQRSDGAILMLVIDGRQVISMGATMDDLVNIMLDYGAVNACNLDGGSSSLMWYQGDYVNNCASVIGIRPVPTAILVLKEGANDNG